MQRILSLFGRRTVATPPLPPPHPVTTSRTPVDQSWLLSALSNISRTVFFFFVSGVLIVIISVNILCDWPVQLPTLIVHMFVFDSYLFVVRSLNMY